MKILKNPVVAVILAIAIILASSFLSAKNRLTAEFREVTDGFYTGVEYNGYMHKSISSQLEALCAAVEDICSLAKKYAVDASTLSGINGELKSSISAKHGRISSIYSLYDALIGEVYPVLDALSQKELTGRDTTALGTCFQTVKGVEIGISESGYNESVREYLTRMGTLQYFFIGITGVDLPEKFS